MRSKNNRLGVAVGVLLVLGGLSQAQPVTIAIPDDSSTSDERSVEVIKEAYRRLGLTVEFLQFPVKRANVAANTGAVDGVLYRREGFEREYPNLVRIPVAVKRDDIVAVAHGTTVEISGWDSLLPYTVGCLLGFDSAIQNLAAGQRAVTVNSADKLYAMLEVGRIDIIADARTRALQMIEALDLKDVRVLEPPLLSVSLYHYVNARRRDLIPPLTRALADMAEEGLIP